MLAGVFGGLAEWIR
ncbi:hypothetical protein [Gracilibacillus halophilus]